MLTGLKLIAGLLGALKAEGDRFKTALEDKDKLFERNEKQLFFNFMRKMLSWRPEDRFTAGELLKDPLWPGDTQAMSDCPGQEDGHVDEAIWQPSKISNACAVAIKNQ